jgi:hypothetical protein
MIAILKPSSWKVVQARRTFFSFTVVFPFFVSLYWVMIHPFFLILFPIVLGL